jgi:hypothetical protein
MKCHSEHEAARSNHKKALSERFTDLFGEIQDCHSKQAQQSLYREPTEVVYKCKATASKKPSQNGKDTVLRVAMARASLDDYLGVVT